MLTIGKKVGRGGANVANDVMLVQVLFNVNLSRMSGAKAITMDGKSGSNTIAAIEKFQKEVVGSNSPDGRVDPNGATINALIQGAKSGAPANMTAVFEKTRLAGARNQMKIGRIAVNNTAYFFVCGGHGRGNIPIGQYQVTAHRNSRSENSFSTDGVGYSFALSDKKDARAVARGDANPTRTLLRIHPDGGSTGTNGCIGILGGAQTQMSFRTNMNLELTKTKIATLTVR